MPGRFSRLITNLLPPKYWAEGEAREVEIRRFVKNITGYRAGEVSLYQLAFRHISMLKEGRINGVECNERLEFLGDAILGSVIAEYLYKRFVRKDEGFLTEMRSKIVNRGALNDISLKLGLDRMLEYDVNGNWMNRSIFGNTFEAFVGALYLDHGYRRTQGFIINRIIQPLINVDQLAHQDLNYKSRLMEYAQKNRMEPVSYEIVDERPQGYLREFTIAAKIGDVVWGLGSDTKKKFAEQKASEAALIKLQVIINPTLLQSAR